jgi:hypothetical protein
MLGLANDGEVLVYLRNKPVFLGEEKTGFPKEKSESGYFNRCSKLAQLVQSCIDSNFLIIAPNPMSDAIKEMNYFKVTDRGTDLLHFLGFWKIAWEKYSSIVIFVWGILAAVGVKLLFWLVSQWGTISTAATGLSAG